MGLISSIMTIFTYVVRPASDIPLAASSKSPGLNCPVAQAG